MNAGGEGRLTHWEGEPVATLQGLLKVPHFEAWSVLSSTNDRVRSLAREGAPPWTTVVAESQTAGRGRSGSAWSSPAGAGLWFSFLLRPGRAVRSGLASFLAGIALARAVEGESGVPVGLKWPNDLWMQGRKAAGILCEVEDDGVVVGVGLNIRRRPDGFPPALRDEAISVEEAGGQSVSRFRLLRRFLAEARPLMDPLRSELDGEVRREWGRRDVLLGRRIRVAGLVGRAAGVDAAGHLVVDVDVGASRTVAGGHVEIVERRGAPGEEG